MLTHYVQSLQGAEWLGILMLILAVTSFAAMVFWAFKIPAARIDRYGRLPLDPDMPAQEDHP
jgi:hypothetical protein